MELDGVVHAGVASVVDGVVSMSTGVADGYGCFVGRVVEIVGESCIRVARRHGSERRAGQNAAVGIRHGRPARCAKRRAIGGVRLPQKILR